jgi:hypothetical protein
MAAELKVVVDPPLRRKQTPGVTDGLEPLHPRLSSAHRLV